MLAVAMLISAATAPGLCAQRPNVLLIVADDLGWGDVGFHGSPIQTPHLDRLAETGVRLEQHYVFPMCTPTRTALMTGRYPSRYGIVTPSNLPPIPVGTETLASALKRAGYETAVIGKWHLGSLPGGTPRYYGFDHAYGALTGAVHPWDHEYRKGPYQRTWHRNGEPLVERGHTTDLLAAEALRWLRQRDGRAPWFLYLPFFAVHTPVDAPQEYKHRYAGRRFFDDPKENESYQRYAAMVTHMDAAIGRIVAYLDERGLRENTLILFTSDNGAPEHTAEKPGGEVYQGTPVLNSYRHGSNEPLRGWKSTLFEGGIRVPALANWRGTLAPRTVTAPLHVVDWMPTLLRLAGWEPEQDLKFDGADVWDAVRGRVDRMPPRTFYTRFRGGRYALRQGAWKLIVLPPVEAPDARASAEVRGLYLFNLAEDPYERHNLADAHPERVAAMQRIAAEQARLDMPLRTAYDADWGGSAIAPRAVPATH